MDMATQPRRMEATANMQDIMDTPMSDITPPLPPPVGNYAAMVVGHGNEDTATTGTKYIQFTLQLQQAYDDVNDELLQEYLTRLDGTTVALSDKTVQSERYYLTENAKWRLKKFLNDLGISDKNDDGSDKSLREAAMEVPGKMLTITITHRASNSGGIFANVSQTSPIA
jgi:hypothetical protein